MTCLSYHRISSSDLSQLLASHTDHLYVLKVVGQTLDGIDSDITLWAKSHCLTLIAAAKEHTNDVAISTYVLHTQKTSKELTSSLNTHLTTQHKQRFDCYLIPAHKLLQKYKLVCFDMDSTLIKEEVIDELAKMAGVGNQVSAITEQAMQGKIDFATSFGQRVALLKGLPLSVIDSIKASLTIQAGALTTITVLKQLGCHTALISGGFIPFAAHIAQILGIDEYHANALDTKDGKLTGNTLPPLIDGNAKARIVTQIAKRLGIGLDEVICVGDGANDIPMMAICGLSVAYRAKPVVQEVADITINALGLDGLLCVLGADVKKATNTLV